MNTTQSLIVLYERDLDRLKNEINAYQHESNLWITDGNIGNSAGNLCLHLIGNLKHFIGLHVGHTPYERDREGEFANKDIPRDQMLTEIEETKEIVTRAISGLIEDQLTQDFPIEFGQGKPSIAFMVIHLASHLGYHLGQINYHRRLLDK